ncbi:glycoside hydrolase family 16 protein [Kiritimatiellota bacterium B12222]|nr:glycoside hydrolase family 16 protein [Kiritimatiellota bacterium B12222]
MYTTRFALVAVMLSSMTLVAASIELVNPPLTLTPGESYELTANYETTVSSIVMIQLFDSSWNKLAGDWKSVASTTTSKTLSIEIPDSAISGSNYHWQVVLWDEAWGELAKDIVWTVSIGSPPSLISLNAPNLLIAGQTYEVSNNYTINENGVSMVQFLTSSWSKVASDWSTISAGSGSEDYTLTIPASTPAGTHYIWQAFIADSDWSKLKEEVRYHVTVQADQSSGEWLPEGEWVLDEALSDDFSGSGEVVGWYPYLGGGPHEYFEGGSHHLPEWPMRYTTDGDRETAEMYSSKTGNHWLNGSGQLVIRAISDKNDLNKNGPKVKTAFLQTGYPAAWDSSEPNNVRWEGRFVSPQSGPLYLSARVRTDELKGYSTWFAFWLFSRTRAYNDTPMDGTEVDVIEIVKSKDDWAHQSFNVANHWKQWGGSESQMFEKTRTDPQLNSLNYVDVEDSDYHTYGIEWTTSYMKCYVDGQLYYTFTENIPSDPVDMMMLLTIEFAQEAWWDDKGDGRVEGPFVSDDDDIREMSRVLVDHVHVYRKQ